MVKNFLPADLGERLAVFADQLERDTGRTMDREQFRQSMIRAITTYGMSLAETT